MTPEQHQLVVLRELHAGVQGVEGPASDPTRARIGVRLLRIIGALAHAGETGAAVEQMRVILAQPFETKPSGLWCDPLLAPLRADPGYRKLMAEHGVDVNIDPFRRNTWPRIPSESLHPGT